MAFYPVTFCLRDVFSCDVLSRWYFILWYFVCETVCHVTFWLGGVLSKLCFILWHFVCITFCPVKFFLGYISSCEILSLWLFVLWHFVYVAFSPVAFCLCSVLSVWRFVVTFSPVIFCHVVFCLHPISVYHDYEVSKFYHRKIRKVISVHISYILYRQRAHLQMLPDDTSVIDSSLKSLISMMVHVVKNGHSISLGKINEFRYEELVSNNSD